MLTPTAQQPALPAVPVEALVFDVFGTVVDWRGSVAEEVQALGQRLGRAVDGEAFADAWRAGYRPAMDQVRLGDLPWTTLDRLHRLILDQVLVQFGLDALPEEERDGLNRAWHRLRPWPDAVGGLTRLRQAYTIAPLSNGNVALITAMARHAGLPWDCVLGAELVRHYKPDPEVYLGAAEFLDLAPDQILMVAAHLADLRAAAACGLKTAFVTRPLEFGPNGRPDLKPNFPVDVFATDFHHLASQLGA